MAGVRLRFSAYQFQRARLSHVLHPPLARSLHRRRFSELVSDFPQLRRNSLFLKSQKHRHGRPLAASVTSNSDPDTVADGFHGTAVVTATPQDRENETSQTADDTLLSKHAFTGDELHFVDATDGWRLALWRYLPSKLVRGSTEAVEAWLPDPSDVPRLIGTPGVADNC